MSKRVIMQNVQYTTASKKVKVRIKRSVIFFRRASGDHNSLRLELTKMKIAESYCIQNTDSTVQEMLK